MIKTFKKILAVLVLMAIVALPGISRPASAATDDNIYVYVNGSRMTFSDSLGHPLIKDNRTFMPVRALAEAMGSQVDWIPPKTVKAVNDKAGKTVVLTVNSKNYTVNGNAEVSDVAPFIDPSISRTFAPFRVIGEGLGYVVDYRQVGNKDIIFDFTLGQTEAERIEIIDKVVKEVETEVGGNKPAQPQITTSVFKVNTETVKDETNFDKSLYDYIATNTGSISKAGNIIQIGTKNNKPLSFVCTNHPELNTMTGYGFTQDMTEAGDYFFVKGKFYSIPITKGMVLKYDVYDGSTLVDKLEFDL